MPRNSTQFVITGTENFRLGSRKYKIFKDRGTNLQNIEKSLRAIYIPDGFSDDLIAKCMFYLENKDLSIFSDEEKAKLKIFVQVDQAGADAKIVSYLLKPANKLRAMFECKVKPHVYLGLMFPEHWQSLFPYVNEYTTLPINKLTAQPGWKALEKAIKDSDNAPAARRYYYIYKQTVHSGNYDIKANTFRLNVLEKSGGKIVLSQRQAEDYISAYNRMLPELREWHYSTVAQAKQSGYLYTLQGYPWKVTSEITEKSAKELYSIVPAATVACITHKAFTDMQNDIQDNNRKGWDLLNNCHDSYLAQVPIGCEDECSKLMLHYMTSQELTSPRGEKFFMGAEAQIGFNWSPSKGCPKEYKHREMEMEIINKYNLLGLR